MPKVTVIHEVNDYISNKQSFNFGLRYRIQKKNGFFWYMLYRVKLQNLFNCKGSLLFLYVTYYDQTIIGLEIISNSPKGINY